MVLGEGMRMGKTTLGVWLVDTSYNREKMLEEVLDKLELGS